MFQLPQSIPLKFTNSNGKWVSILSPNDGSLLTTIQEATEDDIDFLLSKTQQIQQSLAQLKPFQRADILKSVVNDIRNQHEFLSWVIAREGGKPIKDARIEVTRAAATLELCAEETLRLVGEVIPMERTSPGKDHLAFTMRDPIGAVLAISAFNHPLNLIAHQVGCAIASGCSVVLKPAPSTPLSAHFLEEAFKKAGLPEGAIRVVHADIPTIQKLASSREFDFVSFIGSDKVGWELQKRLAPGTRLFLEHGGQAQAIVREDADLEAAVHALTKGAFYHAGQVCISTQVIFIHEKIFSPFLSLFKTATEKLILGSATEESTDVGPLIRPSEVLRIQSWINDALKAGAELVTGNIVSGHSAQFLSPTILANVPSSCSIMTEEAFGPVVCVNTYQDEEELLSDINQRDYIFEASLFTQDITKALSIAQKISAMTLVINNHTAFRVDQMPFGGHKKSGLGMGGVKYAIESLTRIKQIIMKI